MLVIAFVVFSTLSDQFLTVQNLVNLLRQSVYLILVSMGQMLALVTGRLRPVGGHGDGDHLGGVGAGDAGPSVPPCPTSDVGRGDRRLRLRAARGADGRA
jgi:hypothetical protein